MPRERVYSQFRSPNPGTPPIDPTFAVEVGWTRDCEYVEVATTASDGTERIVDIVNEWLKAAGYHPIDLAGLRQRLTDSAPYFGGYHAHLENRADVNHLIRTLKRARDGAFGRDE